MKKILIALVASVCVLQIQIPANATIVDPKVELINRMTQLGVAEQYKESLANLILSGATPESNNPTAVPVSTSNSIGAGWNESRSVFTDGSVSITRIQLPSSPFLRASITGCTVQSGSGYKNLLGCMVSNNTITTYFGYSADFGYVQGARDSIFSVYDPFVYCYFGSCSDPVLSITKKYEDANGPATARLSTVFVLVGGGASSTTSLTLQVGNDSAKAIAK